MDIKISNHLPPGFGTVLNENGDILGILQYQPGQNVTEVLSSMIHDFYQKFISITFDKTEISSQTDFTIIEGVLITPDEDEVSFELSFNPTTLYKVAAA